MQVGCRGCNSSDVGGYRYITEDAIRLTEEDTGGLPRLQFGSC